MELIAVIDVETTGLNPYRHDRVIEIAAVVVRLRSGVVREFSSLVNPERDVGPTYLHGISARDVAHAPRFAEIGSALADVLEGCVAVAGHNVRFDLGFLTCEFARLGIELPEARSLCTMGMSGGGKLAQCCSDYGVPFGGASHEALSDARAAAGLLGRLLEDDPSAAERLSQLPELSWPRPLTRPAALLSRQQSRQRQAEPPSFLTRLLSKIDSSELAPVGDQAAMAYLSLLDRALEDRSIDAAEGASLVEVAERWGLGGRQVTSLHRGYLARLVYDAFVDGELSQAEHSDLRLVAALLGVPDVELDGLVQGAQQREVRLEPATTTGSGNSGDWVGRWVCFTGESALTVGGERLSRARAMEMAEQAGLRAMDSITKKTDILVVADPHTSSGKAVKARRYGIRIVQEAAFWRSVGIKYG